MKDGLKEILSAGRMNLSFGAPDPTSADVAVPKAIKECFDISSRHKRGQQPMRTEQVERAMGHDVKTLKRTWKNL